MRRHDRGVSLAVAACSNGNDGGSTAERGQRVRPTSPARSRSRARRRCEPISSAGRRALQRGRVPERRDHAWTARARATASSCSARARPTSATRRVRSSPTRRSALQQNGIEYIGARRSRYDGITVMTNPANWASTCLNNGDLYALFGPESDGIDTWYGADSPRHEGRRQRRTSRTPRSRSRRPARSPGPTTPSSSSPGSRTRRSSQGVPEDKAASLRTRLPGLAGRQRDHHGDGGLRQRRSGSSGSRTPRTPPTRSKILQVDGGGGLRRAHPRARSPTRPTRCRRTLYIYVNKAKVADSPALKAFVDYYVSDTGLIDGGRRRPATSSSRPTRSSGRSTWTRRRVRGPRRTGRPAPRRTRLHQDGPGRRCVRLPSLARDAEG